jgi:hypothetical protein
VGVLIFRHYLTFYRSGIFGRFGIFERFGISWGCGISGHFGIFSFGERSDFSFV